MRRPIVSFATCLDCGAHIARGTRSCPACGYAAADPGPVLRAARRVGPGAPVAALLYCVLVWASGVEDRLLATMLMLVGVVPATFLSLKLWWLRRKRDPQSFRVRIEALDMRLTRTRDDLTATDARLAGILREIAASPGAHHDLERELGQERALRKAQRRVVRDLSRQVERLRIEQWRMELAFYEAWRDARVPMHSVVNSLEEHLDLGERRAQAAADCEALWAHALADGRALYRQLLRGVPRYLAASRLDPLEEAAFEPEEERAAAERGDLDADTDQELDRIFRTFEAIDEVERPLPEEDSGIRVCSEDDALEEAEAEVPLPVRITSR